MADSRTSETEKFCQVAIEKRAVKEWPLGGQHRGLGDSYPKWGNMEELDSGSKTKSRHEKSRILMMTMMIEERSYIQLQMLHEWPVWIWILFSVTSNLFFEFGKMLAYWFQQKLPKSAQQSDPRVPRFSKQVLLLRVQKLHHSKRNIEPN